MASERGTLGPSVGPHTGRLGDTGLHALIQQVEGNIIQPIVMSQAVRLHPALDLFAMLVMDTLLGLVGLVPAVPEAATCQVLVKEL